MAIDYTPFFEEYKKIVDAADQAFERIESEYPDCVKCHPRCADRREALTPSRTPPAHQTRQAPSSETIHGPIG